ncbi:MAG: ABC transporter permease [Lachnospiraceae bacterium]|nr:ABC transporter permease [Lachnospiraceae bacterium]MCM1238297.1 ABC transporter permease [Lachnospiraceae bacterium]MCM1304376.1 ABC transporter permease [Butyrivibrio sp.]MCM1343832.1 ABC transporter permease [Muribaculaceae bacterium]MCM1410976.1 ABC transporter permease [Lachnospiraceae bacterium]
MVIGIKDLKKLFAISVVVGCAVFVCALFLNYNADVIGIKDEITSPQGIVMYDAVILTGKVVAAVSGGSLFLTSVILLIFYVKNYIDSHGKELGILKALGYPDLKVAGHFWVFGLSVLAGSAIGYVGAWLYMPAFYEVQNDGHFFPDMTPHLHPELVCFFIVLPTLFFMGLSVLYAYFKMKSPVMNLLREVREYRMGKGFLQSAGRKESGEDLSFLQDLRKNTLRSRKILVFFIGFSAFCFSAMTQMAMSMDDLASEEMAWIMLAIGLVLAFMTLLLSLTSVMKANTKTIAMMKVFGYSRRECSRSLLEGYRPVSYIGFALGTAYQYLLLQIMVSVVFADYEDLPAYGFDIKGCLLSLALFLLAYEAVICCYSRMIDRLSIRGIMAE